MLRITLQNAKQYNIVKLTGNFDAMLAKEARGVFGQLAEEPDKNVIIDMSNVEYIDSSGIGAIVFLYKRLRSQNLDLVLKGLREQPTELMQSLRIDQIIKIIAA